VKATFVKEGLALAARQLRDRTAGIEAGMAAKAAPHHGLVVPPVSA
jgi:hypothetical protein